MARLLAVEWDTREARVVIASPRGDGLLVEHAFPVTLVDPSETLSDAAPEPGDKIEAALSARGIRRVEALVALARSSVELKQLSLPPAPDNELPELVRFQAVREFHSLSADWPLDYVSLDTDPEQPRSVLAAALSPATLNQVQHTCQLAGLDAQRLLLRPCGAASLVRRRVQVPERVLLIVELLSEEAELTVLIDGKLVFLRTARLPSHTFSEAGARPLVSEIRRTMAAVQNQLGGQKVEAICLLGDDERNAHLASAITEALEIPARPFDPFAGVETSREVQPAHLENVGRYAPLLGALLDEFTGTRPHYDFLHPRKRPPPPSKKRPAAFAAAAVAAVALTAFGWYELKSSQLEGQIEVLQQELTQLEADQREFGPELAQAEAIEQWLAGDINWLDELGDLSRDFPAADETMLTKLTLLATDSGGQVTVSGVARSRSTIGKLERGLRDDHREVRSGTARDFDGNSRYKQQFDSALTIQHMPREFYEQQLKLPAKEEAKSSKSSGKGKSK